MYRVVWLVFEGGVDQHWRRTRREEERKSEESSKFLEG
jgi:hypothetical protein